jgi:hypothetical protein
MIGWPWFALVQLISLLATVVGWVLLIPFCLARAWILDDQSIKDGRPVDRWRWSVLNVVFGNPEDGVSGGTALVWVNGVLSPYMPNAWAPWRAYCWSAWRNSADGLKYVFAWENGPFKEVTVFGKRHKIGWQRENGVKVPVIS